MECQYCGSQDTTPKTGISKSGKNVGKPWKAYDCNEPHCKNEKGYPNRTFAPVGKISSPGIPVVQKPTSDSGILNEILSIVKASHQILKDTRGESAPF